MAFQGIYRRKAKYVAVRPIRLSASIVMEAGTDVSHLREHQLRHFHRMRRIGLKDSEWTKSMLANQDTKHRPEFSSKAKPEGEAKAPAAEAKAPTAESKPKAKRSRASKKD